LTEGRQAVPSVLVQSSGQLPLPIFREPQFVETDFRAAPSNAEARAWLRRTEAWPGLRLALWGDAGRGKTHLLHIWAGGNGARVCRGAELAGVPEVTAGIAIDDADTAVDATSLLHLLNAAAEARMPVLLAARAPPARWQIDLPDLASRLRAITAVEIGPPEDALLRILLSRLLAERQLRIPEPVQDWLIRRLPRSAAALGDAVARLDSAGLDHRRNITVPFAAGVLADVLQPDEFSETEATPSRRGEALL
jgi:chromosomal replication initiation ATPase DnaA